MDLENIEAFEKRYHKVKFTQELRSEFTADEIRTYLRDVAESDIEPRSYLYSLLFETYDPEIWLPVIYDLLDHFKLMPQGFPYTAGISSRHMRLEDGTWSEETYQTYHPGMQLIYEAVNCYPDFFVDRLHLLFIHHLSPGREEEILLWRKYGSNYISFFKNYVSEKRHHHQLEEAIVKMLMTENEQLKELARETITQHFKTIEDICGLNDDLKKIGMHWQNNTWNYLHSPKPLHLIFPDNFLKLQSDKSFHPEVKLPYSYDWGGWRTVHKLSGKKLKLQHLITLDPVPESLGVKSVKRIAFVVDMYLVEDEGSGYFYQHNENGDVVIAEEDEWVHKGSEDYTSNWPAFNDCKVQVADLGKEYTIQKGTYGENNFRIGGSPHFIQDYHYPSCNCCKQKMQFVIQMDAGIPQEDGDELMWGGGGMGYLYWCDNCRISNISWFCS